MSSAAATSVSADDVAVSVAVAVAQIWFRCATEACTALIEEGSLCLEPEHRGRAVDGFLSRFVDDVTAGMGCLRADAAEIARPGVVDAAGAEFSAVVGLLAIQADAGATDADLVIPAGDLISLGQSWVTNRTVGVIRGAIFAADNPVVNRRPRVAVKNGRNGVRELAAAAEVSVHVEGPGAESASDGELIRPAAFARGA
jgi:hypothetical protein